MKDVCYECKRKLTCNMFDRSRGMPCKDFKKESKKKQEEKQWTKN